MAFEREGNKQLRGQCADGVPSNVKRKEDAGVGELEWIMGVSTGAVGCGDTWEIRDGCGIHY